MKLRVHTLHFQGKEIPCDRVANARLYDPTWIHDTWGLNDNRGEAVGIDGGS
jgi:hypothetical protein